MDCFFNTRHAGIPEENCICIEYGASKWINLYIQTDTTHTKIEKTLFKANGSPYVIAGMEWLCRQMEGSNIIDLQLVDTQQIMKMLGIPQERHAEAIQIQTIQECAISALKE